MRVMRRTWLTCLTCLTWLFLAASCDYGFKPESLVDDLRVLGIRSTPANLAPGEVAQLEALTPDPTKRPTTVLWLGCEADPFNLNRTACADTSLLEDPSSLGGGEGALPNGVSVIGFNSTASYGTSATLFDALAADDTRRQTGTVGQLLAFTVAEAVSPFATREELQGLFDRVKRKELRAIVSLYRIHVSQSPERNSNPVVGALTVDGARWPTGARVAVKPGTPVTLDLEVPESAFEPYTSFTPDGPVAETERLLAAWYSTAGRFSHTRTALRGDVKTRFTPPGSGDASDEVPVDRTATVWGVVRDARGGQSWRQWPVYVCDDLLPEPRIAGVEWPSNPRAKVVLRGADLSSILDVSVDGMALEQGAFVSSRGTWEGSLPEEIPIGLPRGEVTTRTCQRRALGVE